MTRTMFVAVVCAAAVALLWQSAVGQEETKTTADPIPGRYDQRLIWNFHFHGKKRRGDVLELVKPEDMRGRTLVVTKLELRMRQSTRVRVIEHEKVGERRGKPVWKKRIRRSELFSIGTIDSTSKWVVSDYDSLYGLKFAPGSRPAVEVTFGGGEMAVYAEGYRSRT